MSREAQDRLQVVVKQINEILQDVGPKLIKLTHLRTEMELLTKEIESHAKGD